MTVQATALRAGVRLARALTPEAARAHSLDSASRIGFAIAAAVYVTFIAAGRAGEALDGYAYWAFDPANPYVRPPNTADAFLYAPPAALFFGFFHILPWPIFLAALTAANLATVLWLGGRWALLLLLTPWVAVEVLIAGNVNLIIAAVSVIGLRFPAFWSVILLSKVTPGLGALWFAFRGEWRKLGVAVSVTAAIALASAIVAPDLWRSWLTMVTTSGGSTPPNSLQLPFQARAAIAIALLAFGARTNRPQVVPIATMLCLPVMWGQSFAMVAAAFYVVRTAPRARRVQ